MVPPKPPVDTPLTIDTQPLFPDTDDPLPTVIEPDNPADVALPLTTVSDPELQLVLTPLVTTTAPPRPDTLDAPPCTITAPPFALLDDVRPALSRRSPPTALLLLPTITLIAPPWPLVADPVPRLIQPLFPDTDKPVLICSEPDTPLEPTSDDDTCRDPEPLLVLDPDDTVIDPPTVTTRDWPDDSTMLPLTPESLLPTVRLILPDVPPVAVPL